MPRRKPPAIDALLDGQDAPSALGSAELFDSLKTERFQNHFGPRNHGGDRRRERAESP